VLYVVENIKGGLTMESHSTAVAHKDDTKRTYTVEEIAEILHIGRTSAYSLVKEKHFSFVSIGSAIRISKKSFDDWLDKNNLI